MAYEEKFLKKTSIKKMFLLDKDILFQDVPELLSMRKFAGLFYIDPMNVVRYNRAGLVVMRKNSHGVLRIDARKTFDKLSAHFKEKDLELQEKNLDKSLISFSSLSVQSIPCSFSS